MSNKHTPGPWIVDQDDRPGMEWNRHIVSGDSAICFMAHSDGKEPERDEANARLIAAAPDLLETLIFIAELHSHEIRTGELASNMYEAACSAHAAIAKATGANNG